MDSPSHTLQWLAPLAFLSLASFAPIQDEPAPKPEERAAPDEIYPPVRHKTRLLCFTIADDAKAELIRKAVADLGTKETDGRIAYGPVRAGSKPKHEFLAIEVPATVDPKDALKALKRGSPTAELMSWTCLQSEDKNLGRGLGGGMAGWSPRDFILGLSADLRWVEAQGGFVEFFFLPGKLTRQWLEDRFNKLVEPWVKQPSRLVEETFTWPLADPLEAAAAKRAEKTIAKLDGVTLARIDVAAKTLKVNVVLDNLHVSGPPRAMPGFKGPGDAMDPKATDATQDAPRVIFDTNPVLDALEREKIGIAPAPKPDEKSDKDDKKGG